MCYTRGRSKQGTKTSTVITVVATTAARTSDVWRGWNAPRERDRERGRKRRPGNGLPYPGRRDDIQGWRTWYSAHRTILQDGSEDFSFYSSRFVFLSAMDPTSRICSRQPCSFPAALIRLFSKFRHVRAPPPAPPDRMELKCNLSTFRLDQKSKAKWSFYVSRNHMTMDNPFTLIALFTLY